MLCEDAQKSLEQPAHGNKREPGHWPLVAALELGWRVEEPVILRHRWGNEGPRVYHFILRRAVISSLKLITIQESPEMERFVHEAGWRTVMA